MSKRLQLAIAVLFAATAPAQLPHAPAAHELIERYKARLQSADFRFTGRIVRVNAGQRQSYRLSARARAVGGTLKTLYEITDPATARIRVLFENDADGRITIRTARPGDSKPRTVPFEEWDEPFLGSEFNYEDLLENYLFWTTQKVLREEKCGARNCYVLQSTPGSGDKSHYSSVTTWMATDIDSPLKVEKTLRSGATKMFVFYGLRQSKGMWSPSQIEAKGKNSSASTLLMIERGSGHAHVPASELDVAALVRP